MRLVIELTEDELMDLQRPIKGNGGFQSLFRRIQKNIDGVELSLDAKLVKSIVSYARNYGRGGYQDRLENVLSKINQFIIAVGGEPI